MRGERSRPLSLAPLVLGSAGAVAFLAVLASVDGGRRGRVSGTPQEAGLAPRRTLSGPGVARFV